MGSNYQEKLQRREAEARRRAASAPAKPTSTPARVEQSQVRAWVDPAILEEARSKRQEPVRSPQFQAASRTKQAPPAFDPISFEAAVKSITNVVNEKLDQEDTSMFSLGETIDPSTFPRNRN